MRGAQLIKAIIELMRPAQWTKNTVVFAALIFSKNVFNWSYLCSAILAFAVFCLLSSATYTFNDIIDRQSDRAHPHKKNRPIPSGRVNLIAAGGVCIILMILSFGISLILLPPSFTLVALLYFLLNICYSLFLKRVIILDVISISIGFVLRAIAGVEVLVPTVELSTWLLVCTFFLSLFLAISKRRNEMELLEENAKKHRRTLEHYSAKFIDGMIAVVTASTVMSYTLYTISEQTIRKMDTANLVYTIPFVIFGIFRYLYLVYVRREGGSPTRLLVQDKPLLVGILLWIVAVVWILYW
jgi:4-hydroxybenzoate polyprenyltransferase